MSSAITLRSRSDSGTSPSTIRWARPSTIAVLPTPGSPISTGLFFVRRERTWITRRISSSRPITGSSLPSSAARVRSLPNFASDSYCSSAFSVVARCEPRIWATTSAIAFFVAPLERSASPADELWPASASSRCSVVMNSSRISRASCSAARSTARTSGSVVGSATVAERRQRGERGVDVGVDGRADAVEDPPHERVVGAQQRREQVDRGDLRVLALGGEGDRGLDGLAGLLRESV